MKNTNLKEELEKILKNNVWGLVCTCGGGGLDNNKTCDICNGTGIYNWEYGTAIKQISSLLEQEKIKWLEALPKEKDIGEPVIFSENIKIAIDQIKDTGWNDCLQTIKQQLTK
jgi:hypothetical protein